MIRQAIVTGASKGVGYETCKLLANNGYKVIAVSRNIEKLQTLISSNIEVYQLDLTDFDQIKKFAKKYQDITIDLLVHNAGGGLGPTSLKEEEPEHFNYAYSLNVSGPMLLSKLFISNMSKSNNPTTIFVSSIGGKFPYQNGGNYVVSKRAIGALVDLMRIEYTAFGIKTTEICPGGINTIEGEDRLLALSATDMAETIK
jgi:NADP-dependent 3-hydroxy acid dehydrogenase YdfG